MRSSRFWCVAVVLLVGLESALSLYIQHCPWSYHQLAEYTKAGDCTWECLPFHEGVREIQHRIMDGYGCDHRHYYHKDHYWQHAYEVLLTRHTCAVSIWGDSVRTRLCVSSAVAISLTNKVGRFCMPEWREKKDLLYRYPEITHDVLDCRHQYTFPFHWSNREMTETEISTGKWNLEMEDTELSIGNWKRGLENSKVSRSESMPLEAEEELASSRQALTCMPGCSSHQWRSNVSVNGACKDVCANASCSNDFTFNHCFDVTVAAGLTNPDCSADAITRQQCFS